MEQLQVREIENDGDWMSVRAIREEVFIGEQNCPPEEEWDVHDVTSTHFLAEISGRTAGTARLREVEVDGERAAKLERFALLHVYRGRGFGKQLIKAVMHHAFGQGYHILYLHAQIHLEALYRQMGFKRKGEPFDEAGIPHIAMIRVNDLADQ